MLRRVIVVDDSEMLTERTASCCGGASYTTKRSSVQMDASATFDELAAGFLLESGRRLDAVEQALLAIGESAAANTSVIEDIRRELHIVEGNAVMMGFRAVQERAREIQGIVGAPRLTPAATSTVLHRIDDLRTLLHEAVRSAGGEHGGGGEGGATSLLIAPESIETLIRLLADSLILGPRRIHSSRLATRLAAYSRSETASES